MAIRCHNHPVPTTTDARLRAILVNYRSLDDVAARLASEALAEADVIVVDNASDPRAIQELCHRHGATAVLLLDNRGFAAGVNAGWSVAQDRAPLPLLLLNPDAQLTGEAVDRLLVQLQLGRWDGVGPLLMERPGRPQVGAAGGPVTLRSVAVYFLMLGHVLPRTRGVFLTRKQARAGGRVHWLCMASCLLAPDALVRFGPVPEDELVYAEDLAWGTAATDKGARFCLDASVEVPHQHGSSGGSEAWVGALTRLLRTRLGPIRGRLAIIAVHGGLLLRSGVRRILAP
jgi:N-acetylglucosaminyl-diphospho-decaprenol L-rhamnosyltransferase